MATAALCALRIPSGFTFHSGQLMSGMGNRQNALLRAASNDEVKADPTAEENGKARAKPQKNYEALESRIGRRRRRKRENDDVMAANKMKSDLPKARTKPWEVMSLTEKIWELYVGEKGGLFWLNKIAYASIFVMIGGWIVFRFILPAFGLYQLDSTLLPPDKAFGS